MIGPGRRRPLRRRRLLGSALALAGVAGLGLARGGHEQARPDAARALRPPGAVPEGQFDAACVRCGLCVQACPFGSLRLAGDGAPVAIGTPFFVPRETPCAMCAELPCQRACPTGALGSPALRITDARMGLAGLSRPAACYSYIGAAACNSCFKACPLRGRAITMKRGLTAAGGQLTPTVDAAVCTGCGLCEKACIASQPAITVATRRPPAGTA